MSRIYRIFKFSVFLTTVVGICSACTPTQSIATASPVADSSTTSSPAVYPVPTIVTSPTPTLRTYPLAPGKTSSPITTLFIAGEFDIDQALGIMYQGEILSIQDGTIFIPAFNELNYAITFNLVAPYQENGRQHMLVITKGVWDTCHICKVRVDGATFSKTDIGWALSDLTKGIAELGSFGHIDPGSLIQIGPKKYGVLLVSKYGNQGYQGEESVLIADPGGVFHVLFRIYTSEAYIGDVQQHWSMTASITFIPGSDPEYYDIHVVQQGTDRQGKTAPPLLVYVFEDDRYVLKP